MKWVFVVNLMNYVWDFVTLHDLNSKLTVSNGLRKFYDCS